MSEGLAESPLATEDFPDDWLIVADKESEKPTFMAFPPWLFDKLKNGSYISDEEMSRYKSEVGDLIIEHNFKKN